MPVFADRRRRIPSSYTDVVANDSDKTITVPSGEAWEIQAIHAELVTTATVGNRDLAIEFGDGTDGLCHIHAGASQAASLTRHYQFAPGLEDLTAFKKTDNLTTPIPPLALGPGWTIRIYDESAVDATADDLSIYIAYNKVVG